LLKFLTKLILKPLSFVLELFALAHHEL